jgi:hypothetical protein
VHPLIELTTSQLELATTRFCHLSSIHGSRVVGWCPQLKLESTSLPPPICATLESTIIECFHVMQSFISMDWTQPAIIQTLRPISALPLFVKAPANPPTSDGLQNAICTQQKVGRNQT